jgi:hypothetical protein
MSARIVTQEDIDEYGLWILLNGYAPMQIGDFIIEMPEETNI